MNILSIILYSISIMLYVIGGIQFIQIPRSKANYFLGTAMFLIGIGVFQALYFLEPLSTRMHIILLLPLNLIFFPYYFSLKYIESFAQKDIFPYMYIKLVLYSALIEIAAHLMPIGVIIFTKEYSRQILDLLFNIRNIIYILFIIIAVPGTIIGDLNIRRIHTQDGLDKKIYFRIRLFLSIIIILSVLVGISIVIPQVMTVNRFIYYIPQIMIGSYFIIWGIYNIILNQMIISEFIDQYRETRQTVNPYYARLISLLEDEKIYRNAELRISDVAERLSISPNYLSRIINEFSAEGFNDLINRYRVSEVIEKIQNNEFRNKTLLSLSVESGFSSKSTFQSVFKKVTGKTPSEYKIESQKQ